MSSATTISTLGVTQGLILSAIAVTALVQAQRISPASLALSPGPPWEQDPWRLFSCLFYSDGFSIGFAIRLHVLARFSATLEHTAFAHGPDPADDEIRQDPADAPADLLGTAFRRGLTTATTRMKRAGALCALRPFSLLGV